MSRNISSSFQILFTTSNLGWENENTLNKQPLVTPGNVRKFHQKWTSRPTFSEKCSYFFAFLKIFREKKSLCLIVQWTFLGSYIPKSGKFSVSVDTFLLLFFFSHRCGQGISQNSQTRTDFAKWSLSVEILCLEKT